MIRYQTRSLYILLISSDCFITMVKGDSSEGYCFCLSSSLGNMGLDPMSLISMWEEFDFSFMVSS